MKIIDKIFRDKKSNSIIYIILAAGILMLVCANSFTREFSDTAPANATSDSIGVKTSLEGILSDIDGVGKVSVMIASENSEGEKDTKSVLVVADGGNNSAVKEKIIRAVKAALGIDAHKIEVFERKEEQ